MHNPHGETIPTRRGVPFKQYKCNRCDLEVDVPDCHRVMGMDPYDRLSFGEARRPTDEIERRTGLRVERNPFGPGAWLVVLYCTGVVEPNKYYQGEPTDEARRIGEIEEAVARKAVRRSVDQTWVLAGTPWPREGSR